MLTRCTRMNMYVGSQNLFVLDIFTTIRAHKQQRTHKHTHTQTQTKRQTHAQTHKHTHTQTQTHTHTHSLPKMIFSISCTLPRTRHPVHISLPVCKFVNTKYFTYITLFIIISEMVFKISITTRHFLSQGINRWLIGTSLMIPD